MKHSKLFFVISLIVSILVLIFGLYIFTYKEDINEDKLVSIIIIVLGMLGLFFTLFLKKVGLFVVHSFIILKTAKYGTVFMRKHKN